MDKDTKKALQNFFQATDSLAKLGIIHSKFYIENIGTYLGKVLYELELTPKEKEYDGLHDKKKVKVVINNCPVGTPVKVPVELSFDELIVILGPGCFLRPNKVTADFIFYRYSIYEVKERFLKGAGKYIGRKDIFASGWDKTLNLSE